jgi:hypothetical protein
MFEMETSLTEQQSFISYYDWHKLATAICDIHNVGMYVSVISRNVAAAASQIKAQPLRRGDDLKYL